MFKYVASIFCAVVLLSNDSFSQFDNYSIENFFIEEGFPVIRIQDINQDQDGVMWFCSEKQLHSFNGSQFNLELEFSNSDFSVNKIFFDNNGYKWLIDFIKVSSYNINSIIGNIKIYDTKNEEVDVTSYLGIEKLKIKQVYQSNSGKLTLKVQDKYFIFDKSSKELVFPKGTVSLAFTNDNYALLNRANSSFLYNLVTKEIIQEFGEVLSYKAREYMGSLFIRFSTEELHSYDIKNQKQKFISDQILRLDNLFTDYIFDNT